MEYWKGQLYEKYVSSTQAASIVGERKLNIQEYPYFRKLVKAHLPKNKDLLIADIGCGHGSLLFCLKEFGYEHIKGVDVSAEQIELAQKLGIKEAELGDMWAFLEGNPNSFDIIFLMDILEHLHPEEMMRLLGLVTKALKANGRVIIHVPNGEGLFGMRIRYGDLTHENCFTPQSMRQVLNIRGYKKIQFYEDRPIVHGIKSFLRLILWSILTIPHRLLLIAETGELGHVLSQNMLVVAQKID